MPAFRKKVAGIMCAAGAACLVMAGASAVEAGATYPCGGDQVLNPNYGIGFGSGSMYQCLDTLQPNTPGAWGPDGYTPCVGDRASKMSPFCSDPGGSF